MEEQAENIKKVKEELKKAKVADKSDLKKNKKKLGKEAYDKKKA